MLVLQFQSSLEGVELHNGGLELVIFVWVESFNPR